MVVRGTQNGCLVRMESMPEVMCGISLLPCISMCTLRDTHASAMGLVGPQLRLKQCFLLDTNSLYNCVQNSACYACLYWHVWSWDWQHLCLSTSDTAPLLVLFCFNVLMLMMHTKPHNFLNLVQNSKICSCVLSNCVSNLYLPCLMKKGILDDLSVTKLSRITPITDP